MVCASVLVSVCPVCFPCYFPGLPVGIFGVRIRKFVQSVCGRVEDFGNAKIDFFRERVRLFRNAHRLGTYFPAEYNVTGPCRPIDWVGCSLFLRFVHFWAVGLSVSVFM